MGEIKPLGSEKLIGDEKLKRILEITYYNSNNITENQSPKSEYIIESVNGFYGIVKERDGYYVKRGLTEDTLDYIGGLFMKKKNKFRSYGEALKRLDLLRGQELIQEDTKYVLKVNKPKISSEGGPTLPDIDNSAPQALAPPPMPDETSAAASNELPEPELPDTEEEPVDDESMEKSDFEEGDRLKSIQKLTGKLGEKLRDYEEEIKSEDIKYVINSVLSAINLDKLEEDDKEEILSKLDGEEEDYEGEDASQEEPEIPNDNEGDSMPEAPPEENEFDEGIGSLEELIDTPIYDDVDYSKEEEPEYDEPEEIEADEQFPYIKARTKKHDYSNTNIGGKSQPFKKELALDEINPVDPYKVSKREKGLNKSTSDKSEPYGKSSSLDETKPVDPYKTSKKEQGLNKSISDKDEPYAKEIELDELTNMINTTVKETLMKYFE